jgi:hypothetical protein
MGDGVVDRARRHARRRKPDGDPVSARRALWGVAIAAAYVAVAVLIPGATSRPLFDVGGPQPYHWVNPPPEFAPTNQAPGAGQQSIALHAGGSDAATASTADAQASLILMEGTFAPRAGETSVVVKIDPLDPATVGVKPPSGQRFDGNAYKIAATYKKSGADAAMRKPATIVLQFPLVATHLLRLDGEGTTWTDLKADPVAVQLQIFSNTDRVGTFVATGPPLNGTTPKKGSSFLAALLISSGAALAAVIAGFYARKQAAKRKRARSTIKRPPPGSRRKKKR